MEIIIEEVSELSNDDLLHAMMVACLIILVTAILSHLLTKAIRRIMQIDGVPMPSSSIVINVVRVVVWGLGACVVLAGCFGVNVNAALAALGVGGIALSLGLKDTIANFLGGIQITVMGIAHPGDYVDIGSSSGIVQDVTWRQPTVRDIDGNTHIIPNSVINATTVVKRDDPYLVIALFNAACDVSDLDALAEELAERSAAALEPIAAVNKKPFVVFMEVGEYGVKGKVVFSLYSPENARVARDAVIRAIAPLVRTNVE
ncbi:MAG: mechanosensitive ion channel [Eggerthellaceae bacterium]|nr:mechanosensitive ion channel [Eggerthellaceae bacterium]